jgi:membrane metallo-endopeptidase-like protein 1
MQNYFNCKAYLDYMVDVATFLGAEPNFARTDMLDVLQFEMQLANISLPREERRNATR